MTKIQKLYLNFLAFRSKVPAGQQPMGICEGFLVGNKEVIIQGKKEERR